MNEYTPLEISTLSVYLQICTDCESQKHFSVDEISNALGYEPFQSFTKGNPGGFLMLPAEFSLWRGLKSESSSIADELPVLSDYLTDIIKKLFGKTDYLKSLKADYNAKISIVISPIIVDGRSPDLNISSEQLKLLSDIGINIEFDMYVCPFEFKKK